MRIVNPVGKKGEDLAYEYLKKKGYTILERNYRKQYSEIDIIALTPDKKIVVFVEVKARSSHAFGTPLEAITPWKIKLLLKTIALYISSHKNLPEQQRIDAIAVTNEVIEHIQNVTG